VAESLLQAVLDLLDQVDCPVVSHAFASAYGPEALDELVSESILHETAIASEIPRPERFGPGPDLVVRETARGLFGVAGEDDYFDPVPLTELDVRQYEVMAVGVAAKVRKENGIAGSGFRDDNGLISLGQKSVDEAGIADVYFSLPNHTEDAVIARCRRLAGLDPQRRIVLLTPAALCLSTEAAQILASSKLTTLALTPSAAEGRLALDWHAALGIKRRRPIVMPDAAGRRPRGFPANADEHYRIAEVISEIGSDWSSRLVEVCRRLQNAGAVFPESLRSQECVDTWDEIAEDILGSGNSSRRERVAKYIKYRINWVRRNQPAQNSLAKVSP